MNVWLPNILYKTFPLVCVLVGFVFVMVAHNPFAILLAACLYIYSFRILWLRLPEEEADRE